MATGTRLDEMKAIIRDYYDALSKNQDLSCLDDKFTPDFVDHSMPPRAPKGAGPTKAWLEDLKAAFPDLKIIIDELVAEGDLVAMRARWTGTHAGDFFGVHATGYKVSFGGAVFWRIEGDRIAERWGYIDIASLMRQLQSG